MARQLSNCLPMMNHVADMSSNQALRHALAFPDFPPAEYTAGGTRLVPEAVVSKRIAYTIADDPHFS